MPWEFRGDSPIYAQLMDQLRRRIVSGDLPPGARLPSVRDLAAQAGVNPNTMQRAMAELERLGLVYSRALRRDLAREQIDTFLAGMAQLGFHRGEILTLLEEEGEKV